VNAAFPRSSPTVLASVFEVIVITLLTVACGGAGAGLTEAQNIPFADHGSTQQSGYVGEPRIVVATDPASTGLGQLASREEGRLYVAVFVGSQRTGGFAVRVVRIDRAGDTLTVRAMFDSPAPAALTIQVLTSPAHLVSIDRRSAASARDVVLVDQSAAERARSTVPQSQP
jgi:protease stability complex PrcB-like protein